MISPTLIYDPTSEQVARAIISSQAYLISKTLAEDDDFTWKTGIRAPVYLDCRVLAGDPGATAIITRALGSCVRANFPRAEIVVGIAQAGIVWASLTAHELGLPMAFIRNEPKGHGRCPGRVECSPPRGLRAVVLDDLVASGDSIVKGIEALMEEKEITTIGVQSIVNWDFLRSRHKFRELRVPVRALVSFPQILASAVEAGQISPTAGAELALFYANPSQHVWDRSALKPIAISTSC